MAGRADRKAALRLLDANLNRAREGIRVLEDTARFLWDDRGMFLSLRDARHDLDDAARKAYPALVAGRDSAGDPGRRMAEPEKRDAKGLVPANFRRAQEICATRISSEELNALRERGDRAGLSEYFAKVCSGIG